MSDGALAHGWDRREACAFVQAVQDTAQPAAAPPSCLASLPSIDLPGVRVGTQYSMPKPMH